MPPSVSQATKGEAKGDIEHYGHDYRDHAGEKGILAPLFRKLQVTVVKGTVGQDWKYESNYADHRVDDGHQYGQGEVSLRLSAHNYTIANSWMVKDRISGDNDLFARRVVHIFCWSGVRALVAWMRHRVCSRNVLGCNWRELKTRKQGTTHLYFEEAHLTGKEGQRACAFSMSSNVDFVFSPKYTI